MKQQYDGRKGDDHEEKKAVQKNRYDHTWFKYALDDWYNINYLGVGTYCY